MFSIFSNTIKLLNSLINLFMATRQDYIDRINAEKQQFADYKATTQATINEKDLQIADKDALIAQLQEQLASGANLPDDLLPEIDGIVTT